MGCHGGHPGETDLGRLLRATRPVLDGEIWVFCTTGDAPPDPGLASVAAVYEAEGWTTVVPRARADAAGLAYDGTFRRITLTVHSSLHAVGFLAAVSGALAEAGVACNVVSGGHHDHLFVPAEGAEEAMRVLGRLGASAAAPRG